MINKSETVRVSCHCGSIHLEVFLLQGLEHIIRCNCSMCVKNKGAGMVCVPLHDVTVLSGQESMTEYNFHSGISPHVFCIICGVHTHHQSRSSKDKLCINLGCINDIDITDYNKKFSYFDGVNHPKDR